MFCGSRNADSDDHKQLIPWNEDSGGAATAQLISSIFGNKSPGSTTVRDDEKTAAAGGGGGGPPVKQSLNKKLHMHSLHVDPSKDKGSQPNYYFSARLDFALHSLLPYYNNWFMHMLNNETTQLFVNTKLKSPFCLS
jgi:hypothetical protein